MGALARSRSSGRLVPLPGPFGCFIRAGGFGCPEGPGLDGRSVAVTVSPDGRNVYVASEDAYLGTVAIFRRFGVNERSGRRPIPADLPRGAQRNRTQTSERLEC